MLKVLSPGLTELKWRSEDKIPEFIENLGWKMHLMEVYSSSLIRVAAGCSNQETQEYHACGQRRFWSRGDHERRLSNS